MKPSLKTLTILSASLLATLAIAAEPKAGADSAKKAASAGNPAKGDQTFVTTAAQSGMAEVALSQMAKEKGSSPEVKQVAEMMIADHTKANDELTKLATSKSFELPSDVGPKHKAAADKLSKMTGAEFDKAYLAQMVTNHKKSVSDFESASKTLKDEELKAFTDKTLPTLKTHLEHVQGVKGDKKAGS